MQLLNLPILFILPDLMGLDFWIIFLYYLSIGLLGLSWYQCRRMIQQLNSTKRSSRSQVFAEMWTERQSLLKRIQEQIHVNIS